MMDFLTTLYPLIVNGKVLKILMITCGITLSLYHYFARNIRKQMSFPESRSKHAVLRKVEELKNEGDKQAKIAYFFYVIASIILPICLGMVMLIVFVHEI